MDSGRHIVLSGLLGSDGDSRKEKVMALLAARITHLLTGALIGAATVAPAASAQSPPPAAPDLGAMAIGAQDLPRGAKVIDEGPTKYPGADAAYERSFTLGRRAARAAGFDWLDSTVALYDDAPTTSSLFRAVRRSLASARGRRELARSIARSLEIPVRRVSVGSVRTLSAGDAS